jgi:hypothetical protein
LNRVELVVYGRGGARQVVDLVDLDVERKSNVVPQDLEARVSQQVCYVVAIAGVEIVHAQDIITFAEQPLAKMRAEESCSSGHQDAFTPRIPH